MYDWLEATAARLAHGVGDDPAGYTFTEDEIARLLDLAGVAAHEGGHKTNAPLLGYLAGVAQTRYPELDLRQIIAAAVGDRVAV